MAEKNYAEMSNEDLDKENGRLTVERGKIIDEQQKIQAEKTRRATEKRFDKMLEGLSESDREELLKRAQNIKPNGVDNRSQIGQVGSQKQ